MPQSKACFWGGAALYRIRIFRGRASLLKPGMRDASCKRRGAASSLACFSRERALLGFCPRLGVPAWPWRQLSVRHVRWRDYFWQPGGLAFPLAFESPSDSLERRVTWRSRNRVPGQGNARAAAAWLAPLLELGATVPPRELIQARATTQRQAVLRYATRTLGTSETPAASVCLPGRPGHPDFSGFLVKSDTDEFPAGEIRNRRILRRRKFVTEKIRIRIRIFTVTICLCIVTFCQ